MRKNRHFLTGILLLVTIGLHAQVKQITGKVTDATGLPIPAASIRLKGNKAGTSADFDGVFKINASEKETLIISGIGFETKEVRVGSSVTLNIQLNTDSKSLSEVVVTGVGVATSKKKLGISVESVSSAQLPAAPTASIDQALIGKISGSQISSISGNPGDPVNIVLRGINSVQGGTKPIILVDGVEVRGTDINSLDLSNIERVEVIKGAASATLYGAQGANGVIQLFTKKGKKGNTAINFSSSYSVNQYINNGNVHKAAMQPYITNGSGELTDASGNLLQYDPTNGNLPGISYVYGGAARAGIWNPLNQASNPYGKIIQYHDHFKEIFQNGSTLNNSLGISGASDKSDYSINVSNNHTVSPVIKNGYVDRSNLTANLGTEVFKGFKLRSVTQLVYTKNTLVPGLGAPGGSGTPGYGYGDQLGSMGGVYGFLNTSPFFDLKSKVGGNYADHVLGGAYLSVNSSNPFYYKEYSTGLDNKVDIIQSFDGDYRVNKFLELNAKYGINFRNETARWTYYNQSTNANSAYYASQGQNVKVGANGPDNTGEIDNYQYNTTFQNFQPSATLRFDLQNDFHSKLPITSATKVAFDWRKKKYDEYDTYGYKLPLAPPINVLSTSQQTVLSDYLEPFVTYGYLVDETLNYGDLAGAEGGFRSDWSSAFGGGSKPFTFPHVNGFFAPSALGFWQDALPAISYLKLRAAYGEAGIQPTPFQRYPVLAQQDLGTTLVYSSTYSSAANANLQVEVTKETELGTDFTINTNEKGTWLSAINGSFSYWKRNSFNVIWNNLEVAPSNGLNGGAQNAINMEGHGFEFKIEIPVVRSRDFSWDFTTNFGHQKSIIKSIAGGVDIPLNSVAGTAQSLSAGQTIGQIYGHKTITSLTQKDPTGKTAYISSAYIDPTTIGNYQVQNGKVIDTATKQIQFTPDKYNLGDPNPKFNMSFINSFTYKGFLTLAFQIDWQYGSHLYNQTKEWMSRDGISGDFAKKVTVNGQSAAWSAYWSSPYYNILGSTAGGDNDGARDYWYENSSFIRLRNVSLAMDFAKFMRSKAFKRVQLYVSGRNILTITKYTGYDPEVSSGTANSSWDRGVDNSTVPNIKSYQVGLNVGF